LADDKLGLLEPIPILVFRSALSAADTALHIIKEKRIADTSI